MTYDLIFKRSHLLTVLLFRQWHATVKSPQLKSNNEMETEIKHLHTFDSIIIECKTASACDLRHNRVNVYVRVYQMLETKKKKKGKKPFASKTISDERCAVN